MLPFATVGQAVVSGAGDRIGVEGAREVRGLDHDPGLAIEFDLDLDLGADLHTGGAPVGVAEAEQVAATHDRDSALPGVTVDRDRDRRPLALTKRLHHLRGNFQPPHRLRRLNVRSELHAVVSLQVSDYLAPCPLRHVDYEECTWTVGVRG